MEYLREDKDNSQLFNNLRIDCKKCFGFCCVALYFSASEGFPTDKEAGQPCMNLSTDFSCSVHGGLRKKGLKGCMAYDCFGAGQKVAQVTYDGHDWRRSPKTAGQMFDVFLVMRQLHEMLWYLTDALTLVTKDTFKDKLSSMIIETEKLTNLEPESLIALDVEAHRVKVNFLLKQTYEFIKTKVCSDKQDYLNHKRRLKSGYNFIGANLTKTNLVGEDLAGKFLIAATLKGADLTGANLIGCDLRDADIRGANLSECIFLTQSQINAAKGDDTTKLPRALVRPSYWKE